MRVRKSRTEFLIIGVEQEIEFYLSTLVAERKSPSYINGQENRL